ncbi:hypothetical protein [Bradyrhizobium sp.]|jgi:hypothetical protein|uniref:hypothetical protein n=1 Tax=Bradyrhizobium sp. TaxID=376 RepID=UPI002E08B2A8|nr:hypothetical protein [Bradyrhizobium sp.]
MTIRFFGPLLCSGLLALAMTTGAIAEARLQIKNIPTGPGDDIKVGRGGGGGRPAGINGHPDSKVGGSVMVALQKKNRITATSPSPTGRKIHKNMSRARTN